MDNKKVVRENSRLTRSFERLRGLKDFFFAKGWFLGEMIFMFCLKKCSRGVRLINVKIEAKNPSAVPQLFPFSAVAMFENSGCYWDVHGSY